MEFMLDRRSVLLTGTLGLGAFAIPGFAQSLTVADARGFTHAVASGEPASDSMLQTVGTSISRVQLAP